MGRHLHILDASDNILFDIDLHTRKPQLRIHKPTLANPDVGNLSITATAKEFTLNIQGRTSTMTSKNWAQRTYNLQSAAAPGNTFSWAGTMGQTCTDERGVVIARSKFSKMSFSKLGTIELTAEALATGEEFVDEILLTGTAILYQRWMAMATYGASGAAAAGSASAAAAAS